jgi:hypothetical protein
MEIFLQRGLDTKLPDGQITGRRREQILSCPARGAAFFTLLRDEQQRASIAAC